MKKAILFAALVCMTVAGWGAAASEKGDGAGEARGGPGAPAAVERAVTDYIQGTTCEVHGVCSLGIIKARYDGLRGKIEKKDGYYVARAEFKAGEDIFDVEYYVEERGGNYTVVKEVLLARNGKPLNEVLWEEGSPTRK